MPKLSIIISFTDVAIYFAALPKPGVWSFNTRSLSMVLGQPTNLCFLPLAAAYFASLLIVSIESLPPIYIKHSMLSLSKIAKTFS